jgi:hypothetical protein
VWLTQLAGEAWVNGQQFCAEAWHEHIKAAHLPEKNNKGDDKWLILPDGSRRCIMSTTRLDVKEMTDYMDNLAAFAAELGVTLT